MGFAPLQRDMPEIGDTKSSAQMDQHKKLIQRFLDKGYTIESQEEDEDTGAGGELVAKTCVTILKPPSYELPYVKFEAQEVFGKYDDEAETFQEWDHPKFQLKAFKKGADMESENDPWDVFDID